MTKKERHSFIIKLINEYEVGTQEELSAKLVDCGLNISQATVSRDINELNLTKIKGLNGKYKYAVASIKKDSISPKILELFRHALVSIDIAKNLLVVKTLKGNANTAGMAIDEMDIPEVLGTIAGDDTLIVIAKTDADAINISKSLRML